ncbi:MAG: dihydrofolate reductase [Candidatus Liptonbacteria bacterium RIFCSPLOWO2_01_FULL_52_25]|uniref:Dihydrofolate reductase n=1 Tax=Candidatus Liptonbacteria bacterium RIFCSPLOWO2_01_FULL_52_25 TaxID=1798650 RepID=A0A1G2CG34_9BACT|nr:MAG: dihydrofolate reductase [Candidatus Liptonbacteria bacterium RIFCSPLOWO2_01_FULL_52_25]
MISIIVAMGKNRVIGNGGNIPWRLPADLKHFKEATMGHAVVMGRKTYESIGKPLPGRTNIVITWQKDYAAPGCVTAASLNEAFKKAGVGEVFVIGGAEIYREAMPRVDKLYVTLIDRDFEGDAYFPEIDPNEWRVSSRKEGATDEKNPYPYSFLTFERIRT